MITFQKIKPETLNIATGEYSGAPKPEPKSIGMDTNEFHKQVMGLAEKKVPLEKAKSAIDKHTEIQDKERAKSMAEAVYAIMGKK